MALGTEICQLQCDLHSLFCLLHFSGPKGRKTWKEMNTKLEKKKKKIILLNHFTDKQGRTGYITIIAIDGFYGLRYFC